VKVDSMNKNGILLEVVQVLSDLDLAISKAYITSDGGWFMDVFHVVDKQGQKVTDEKTIKHIEKVCNFFST
jgi:UTP:GlnB (protein PII) uridylyltransferase